MELKERIKMVGLVVSDCPPCISEGNFRKLMHSVDKGKPISDVSASLLSLLCDVKVLERKLNKWPYSEYAPCVAWDRITVLLDGPTIIERCATSVESISESFDKIASIVKSTVIAKPSGSSSDSEMTGIRKPDCIKVTVNGKRWSVPLDTEDFEVPGTGRFTINDFKIS